MHICYTYCTCSVLPPSVNDDVKCMEAIFEFQDTFFNADKVEIKIIHLIYLFFLINSNRFIIIFCMLLLLSGHTFPPGGL